MAVICMIVIMILALEFGAELGPKVNPDTTTYVPAAGLVLLSSCSKSCGS